MERSVFGLELKQFEFEVVTVDRTGQEVSREPGQAEFFEEDLGDGVVLEMVRIPAGRFVMGSPEDEKERDDDEGPQHEVTVPEFFVGRFVVTQAQYQAVIGQNPSDFKGKKHPVEEVSWNDAVAFCEKLSDRSGRGYRLPSEAEWEYACRAGTTTPFHFGQTITPDLANYDGNGTYAQEPEGQYRGETSEVGSFPPNAFGLGDMHGNVWEWCSDGWHNNYEGCPTDGSSWTKNSNKKMYIQRGGSWFDGPRFCRSARRDWYGPSNRSFSFGFRVACVAPRT